MPRISLGLGVGNVNKLPFVPVAPVVALPNNPAGPIVFVASRTGGNTWFEMSTSTNYGTTYWWDGTSTLTNAVYQQPTKTSVTGIVRLSAFSTNASGINSGGITYMNPFESGFLSIDCSGCSQLNSFVVQSSNYTLSSMNFTGCKSLVSLNISNQSALSVLNMTGCSAVQTFNVTGTVLSSIAIPADSVSSSYIWSNQQLRNVSLRGFTNGGLLYILDNNALRNVDLSTVNPELIYVINNASLSAITWGSSLYTAYDLQAYGNKLSAINISSLIYLASIQLYNNKLTSITMPTGFTSRAGFIGDINLYNNQLDAAALNNFFTNLGTYAGVYDGYGNGGLIRYGLNPGSGSCNPAIATAKGWQVQA